MPCGQRNADGGGEGNLFLEWFPGARRCPGKVTDLWPMIKPDVHSAGAKREISVLV